ncbi:MAG: PEP-CTERM sorting domain-containing protein [Planctomyces sp.]|nr:PEP-CTERM sorting domain-containing protein [Planctomyces sp.]
MSRGCSLFTALLAVCVGGLTAVPSVSAAWVAADGDLSDWGINFAGNTPQYHASLANQASTTHLMTMQATIGGFTFFYVREDSDDSAGDSGFVGPNVGGQNYDGEFLGVGVSGNQLVIAIMTGQRPDNGATKYAPGDILISTTLGDFGIEVGGGAGGVAGSAAAITEGADGTTYSVNGQGFTTGSTNSSVYTAGSVWHQPNWIVDPIPDPYTKVQMQHAGGSYMGLADYIYTRNSISLQHAIIEVAIPFSYFLGADILSVAWAPSCGNDLLEVNGLGIHTAPEPASLAMLAFGGVAVGFVRRRRTPRDASAPA